VCEDRGARDGGADFTFDLFQQVVAALHGLGAGDEHMEGNERSAAGVAGAERVKANLFSLVPSENSLDGIPILARNGRIQQPEGGTASGTRPLNLINLEHGSSIVGFPVPLDAPHLAAD
jgi:hypothetical protein